MEQASPPTPAQPDRLSKEERSRIATEAAKRRWANVRKQKEKAAAKAAQAAAKAAPAKKRGQGPREFSSALKTAEKRLSKAIQERAEAAAKYAVLSAEIPSLQQIIMALRNPVFVLPGQATAMTAPSLEQIMGDQPLAYQNPPLPRLVPQPAPQVATVPVPQQLHPANVSGRAGGGAVGVQLEEPEDEDRFLKESGVAGGEWH
jgi:hypothetical protein